MITQKNHQELVRKVNMYLDNELTPEAERALFSYLISLFWNCSSKCVILLPAPLILKEA